MTDPTIGAAHLFGLFGVVLSGAVLPVVPTGATVSVAAALAEQDVALVVVAGAAGAYLADLGTYAVLRVAGLAGRAVFPEPWEGAAADVASVLGVSPAGTLWQRRGRADAPAGPPR